MQEQDEIAERLKSLKEELLATIPNDTKKVEGMVLTISRVEKKGAIDYKAALEYTIDRLLRLDLPPEAQEMLESLESGIGLESFRKKASSYWDIRRKGVS